MKNFLITALIFVSFQMIAQDFATKLYFKDGIGRVDSIKVGFSTSATDSLNSQLGEIKLSDPQIDTTFFVGISDVRINGNTNETAKFRTKTKYVNTSRPDYLRFINIDLICKNYPLTISWNKSLFQDTNRSKSFIISSHPGGWFDVGEQPHWLNSEDSIKYYTTNLSNDYSKNYLYETGDFYIDSIHSKPVKIWRLYVDFAGSDFNMDVRKTNNSKDIIFPNPCQDILHINSEQSTQGFMQLFSLTGCLLFEQSCSGSSMSINMTKFAAGTYLLQINNGIQISTYKIQKK